MLWFSMEIDRITKVMAELGNETRMSIFRFLVQNAEDGIPTGSLSQSLGIAPSTLAFHLKGLVGVGLVTQERVGRSVLNFPQIEVLRRSLQIIEAECCVRTPRTPVNVS